MKQVVHLSRKYNILLIAIFAVAALSMIIFFIKKSVDHSEAVEVLVKREVNGTIIGMRDQQRGSYYLKIKTSTDTVEINSLPIAWNIKQYGLQVGDSVAKATYGRTMFFYGLKDGKYQLLFKQNL